MHAIRFPGLNAIRFFAAALVITGHTETYKAHSGYSALWSHDYNAYLGGFGVNIFFVLSGFLITYLLLREREKGTVNIRHFYMRRILRIWPLYFLIAGIAFFIMPGIPFMELPGGPAAIEHSGRSLLLYFGMLANVAVDYLPLVPFAAVLWSVAVEEQFYLLWPHVLKSGKHFVRVCIAVALLLFLFKIALHLKMPDAPLTHLVDRTRFSSLIIGGLGAWLYYHRSPLLKFIYNRSVQVISVVFFMILFLDLIKIPFFGAVRMELSALVTCVLIMNIATNTRTFIRPDQAALNHLGKISYGLYVYHMFAVIFFLRFYSEYTNISQWNGWIANGVLLASVAGATVLISHFSYRFFEMPFLQQKLRFSTLVSGDLVSQKPKSA